MGVLGCHHSVKMTVENSIKLLSANCQGLRTLEKRHDVLNYFKQMGVNILCLQDTHLIQKDISDLKKIWNGEIFLSGNKTNSRGVAVLLNKNFEYEVISTKIDAEGNYINIQLNLDTLSLNLTTVYGPNTDDPEFFTRIKHFIENQQADYSIVCGDFNLVLDPDLDSFNYKHINNPKARQTVLKMINDYDLCDIYRNLHSSTKRYTWRRKNPVKQARLDFFLASSNILDIINKCDIKIGYRSDHSVIELEILLNKFICGKGIWKFNNSHLENPKYLDRINEVITEEIQKYAIPVYNLDFLRNRFSDIEMTIDDDTFLEMLLLRIRGETIKFASYEKKKKMHQESRLIKDIETLESSEILQASNMELLNDKRQELQKLRDIKMKGELVRSRQQWLKDGEKPSKYFCSLENRNFIDKTIKRCS